MGYLVPIYSHINDYKERRPLIKVNSIIKPKFHFHHQQLMLIQQPLKKEKHVQSCLHDVLVDTHQFYQLTGRGEHINTYI